MRGIFRQPLGQKLGLAARAARGLGALAVGGSLALCSVLVAGQMSTQSDDLPAQGEVKPGDEGRDAASLAAPLRLVQVRHRQWRGRQRPALALTFSDSWRISGGSAVKPIPDGLVDIAPGSGKPLVIVPVDLRASEYAAFRVRMRVRSGAKCALNWFSDATPPGGRNPGVSCPVLADGEFHEYTLALHVPAVETWFGRVRELRFRPSDQPAHVTIASMELVGAPPEYPQRVTIRGETIEALAGNQSAWTLTLPEQPVFEVHLGMLPCSWQAWNTDGVQFRATLETQSGETTTLFEVPFTPQTDASHRGWVGMQADLAHYARQKVRIHLTIGHLATRTGDYALWGNPMVFSRRKDPGATPVVLISCDTLRADHVSCYGYSRKTTPCLDRFAKEAVVFENAVSDWPWTLPAHMTMLTGLYPKTHRVLKGLRLAEDTTTLAEALRADGYLSAAFTAITWYLAPKYGFPQGFDVYSTGLPYRGVFDVHEAATTWLDKRRSDKLFLFLHNFDVHGKPDILDYELPYVPDDAEYRHFSRNFDPEPDLKRPGLKGLKCSALLVAAAKGEIEFSHREIDYLLALYDDCVRVVDIAIDEFFEELKRRGLYDRALVIVTADHGEEFAEHGGFLHENSYQHCASVPLIVKFPGGRFGGTRVSEPVQLADILPTVLDTIGAATDIPNDGQSLLGVLENRAEPRSSAFACHHWDESVRQGQWKLLRHGPTGKIELYNLLQDPNEQQDLYEDGNPLTRDLVGELDAFYGGDAHGWHFMFCGGRKSQEIRFKVLTNHRFEFVRISPREQGDRFEVSDDGRKIEGTLKTTPGDRDELVAQTAPAGAHVSVWLASDQDFLMVAGQGDPVLAKEHVAYLDPSGQAHSSPTPPSDSGETTLLVWYAPPSESSSEAAKLGEQEIEELKSLGYMGAD